VIALVSIDDDDEQVAKAEIAWLLEGVTRRNQLLLLEHSVPPLYGGAIAYRPEPWSASAQSFSNLREVVLRRWGECKSLSCWAMALHRNAASSPAEAARFTWDIRHRDYAAGQQPRGYRLAPRRGRTRLWHVRLKLPDGSIEDPSERVPLWREGF